MNASRLLIPIVAAALTAGPLAWAQAPNPKAQAGALYQEGVVLFKASKFADARAKFQAAYNLDPAPTLLYNLARAAEEMGDAVGATGHYKAYLSRFPKADDRGEVERRIRVLEAVQRNARMATLTLKNAPAGAAVQLNGRAAPETATAGQWRVDPGVYTIRILVAGKTPVTQQLELKSAQSQTIDYVEASKPKAKPKTDAVVVEPPPPPPPKSFWNDMTISGVSAIGGGVLIAGVGGYFFGQALSDRDDFDAATNDLRAGGDADAAKRRSDAKDAFESDGTLAYVMFSVGGAAIATGATLLILDYVDRDGWAIVPTGTGLGLVGTF